MSPQREHFLDEAAALLIYLEECGAVSRLSLPGSDSQKVIAFAVDAERYRAITSELRATKKPRP